MFKAFTIWKKMKSEARRLRAQAQLYKEKKIVLFFEKSLPRMGESNNKAKVIKLQNQTKMVLSSENNLYE